MLDTEDYVTHNLIKKLSLKNQPIIKVINSISQVSCPHLINLHCHTTCSDGSLKPVELINQASTLGLQHIAITDHHSIEAYSIIKKWMSDYDEYILPTRLWTGIEISCLLKGCLVHVIGLGFDLYSDHLQPYTQGESVKGSFLRAENVIKAIHNANGVSILAHPARYRIDFRTLIQEAHILGIDGIETWYDYNLSSKWSPSYEVCNPISQLAIKLNILSTCGTDTHGYSLLGR